MDVQLQMEDKIKVTSEALAAIASTPKKEDNERNSPGDMLGSNAGAHQSLAVKKAADIHFGAHRIENPDAKKK